jgi:hypothetical protein
MKGVHESVTPDRIKAACVRRETSMDRPGICIACGTEQREEDEYALNVECKSCGEPSVFGSDELAIRVIYRKFI